MIAATHVRAQEDNPCIRDGAELRCLDLQLFLPPAQRGQTFLVDRPDIPHHGSWVWGLGVSTAGEVLRLQGDGGELNVVSRLTQYELSAALGLFERMEVGLTVPLVRAQVAQRALVEDRQDQDVRAMGDTRVSLKVPLRELKPTFGFDRLAVKMVLTLPTGDDANFLGSGYWTLSPSAIGVREWGKWVWAWESGFRFRRRAALGELEQDDEWWLLTGGRWDLAPRWSVISDLNLRVGIGGRTLHGDEVPLEWDGGVRFWVTDRFSLDTGVGVGVIRGAGAPQGRLFLVGRLDHVRRACLHGPEDKDGYEDGDFCADPDNDGDGVLDLEDRCPNDAEDLDGFLDGDGCPDLDNDADGVADIDDPCPRVGEDVDGFRDGDGCPEPDNDEDQVVDVLDDCPMEPEDRDGYQDDDGCPEPGPNRVTVTVTDSRILISERIYFEFDQDTIRSISRPVLDQVADVIAGLAGNRYFRVEGYTDNEGEPGYNLDLSYRRARAVVAYLVDRGVDSKRLEYEGFGSASPVAPNDSAAGRSLNRRVEFRILRAP